MTSAFIKQHLPSSAELPSSDDCPVDNEDQNLLPNLLLLLLTDLWSQRLDWYFGVDMAIYHTTGANPCVPVVPDAFLSLHVERKKGGKSRRSYVLWEENERAPVWVLEMVSHQPGGEYTDKLDLYARLGVLYYVIYNPEFWQRDRQQPFEVYKLESGQYQFQVGEPYWMPELGLGIGRYQAELGGVSQEILTWYDAQGQRHLNAAEQAQQQAKQAQQQVEQERLARARLENYLRSQGIDPEHLPQ
jgi:Uma2 family endonuclease